MSREAILATDAAPRAKASNYPEPFAAMVAGRAAGGTAHHLVNETDADVVILEVGDRSAGDAVIYPADDLAALRNGEGGRFVHKDGTPY